MFFSFLITDNGLAYPQAARIGQLDGYALLGTGFLFYLHSPKSENSFSILSDLAESETLIYPPRLKT